MAAIRVTELSVQEQDGTPNVTGVQTIEVPNGSLTDNGGGSVSLTYGDLTETVADGRYLQKANNLSDVANAATARTSLGLGTAATHAAGDFAQTANNLSDLANAGTARTNLGLGTASTHAAGDFAQTANNLSDLANETTARANLGAATVYNNAIASAPSSPNAGDLWLPSDASLIGRYNGSSWDWRFQTDPIVLPVDSGFSWVNQGSVSLATTNGKFYLQAPASATDAWAMRVKTAPSTPYTLTVRWRPQFASVDYPGAAIIWRNSSSGLWAGVGHYMNIDTTNTPFHVNSLKGDATPKITANYTDQAFAQWWEWVRLKDDGTNRTVYLSRDGFNWYQFHQVGRTDYVTADQIGFGIESRNATWPAFLTIDSWGTA